MNTTSEQMDRLQKLQNVACRTILLADARTNGHIFEMHDSLKLTMLDARRTFHLAVFVYKVVKGLIISIQLAHLFEPLNLRHDAGTRANTRNDPVIPQTRTQIGARAISVIGPSVWNNISLLIRESNTVNTFKNRYWAN